MREEGIEHAVRHKMRKFGVELVKLQKLPGWPDRLALGPHGCHVFVEFKTPRGRVSKLQQATHNLLRKMGHDVLVVRGIDACDDILRTLGMVGSE